MKIFSPILKGTTTVAQGTTNLSGSFTGSLFGTAATASYADNFTVGGTLTAQTINVQIITSSIEFVTGSTRNGALSTNTHQFTGSVLMSGSLTVGSASVFSSTVTANGGVRTTSANGYQDTDGTRTIGVFSNFTGATAGIGTISNHDLGFYTNATERMRITSTGNVGIGVTTPSGRLHILGDTYATSRIYLQRTTTDATGTYSMGVQGGSNNFGIVDEAQGNLTRLFITSAGNVGIGTTSPSSKLHVVTTGTSFTPTATGQIGGNIVNRVHIQSNEPGIMLSSDANGSGSPTGTQTYQLGLQIGVYTTNDIRSQIYFGNSLLSFVYSGDQGSSTSERMRISTNGSIGAPNGTNIYNASDVRLKKNISTTTYGLSAISALNPIKFNWINGFESSEDGKDMLGFVAQEVQTIIPEAVESFGGDINLNGITIETPLRVNEKFIIPVLVKAIQELKSENDTLKEILQRNNIQ